MVQEVVSLQRVKFVANKEFFVGIVFVSVSPLKAATRQVENQESKVICIKAILTKNGCVCGVVQERRSVVYDICFD